MTAERHPEFNALGSALKKRACQSLLEGYGYLLLTLLLLGGTIFLWIKSIDVARHDIEVSVEAVQGSEERPVRFRGIASCGGTTIAAGRRGIRVSTDDGRNWEDSGSETRHALNAIVFSGDCKTAIAVGNRGVVLVSTDGGSTWNAPETHTRNDFYDIAVSGDGRTAIAVGDKGTIRVSQNGGKDWPKRASIAKKRINGVVLSRDGKTAVAVGDDNVIRISRDGGEGWNESGANVWSGNDDFEAVAFGGDGLSAVVVGDDGAILFSPDVTLKDGGWEPAVKVQAPDEKKDTSDFRDVAFSGNGAIAAAVGRGGAIWVSDDDGKTWSSRDNEDGNHLDAVALSDDGVAGVAVGGDGVVLVSEDQGGSWAFCNSGTANRLRAVAFGTGHRTTMIAGYDSTILRSESSPSKICSSMATINMAIVPEGGDAGKQQESSLNLATVLQANFLRVAITLLLMFLVQYLINLARYKLQIAAFYNARRDALQLATNIDDLERLVRSLSPDELDIGHPSQTMLNRITRMIKRLTGRKK